MPPDGRLARRADDGSDAPARRPKPDPPGPPREKGKRGPRRRSCAECRRLKVKCDLEVNEPCTPCVDRGYAAICPEQSQTTGQGHRLFWASTKDSRAKAAELSDRIRSLEDALRTSHRLSSPAPHPLLADELLLIKDPPGAGAGGPLDGAASGSSGSVRGDSPGEEVPMANAGAGGEEDPMAEMVSAFGSLSVAGGGRTKYYGRAANSWWFMHNEEPDETTIDGRVAALIEQLPPSLLAITGSFPLSLATPPYIRAPADHLATLYGCLPHANQAAELRDYCFEFGVIMFNPIPLESYNTRVHAAIWGADGSSSSSGAGGLGHTAHSPAASSTTDGGDGADSPLTLHRLGIAFMVMAIGALVNPRLPPYNVDAERFHQLARAALFGSRCVENPTIEAIQALHLMFIYLSLNEHFSNANTSNLRWSLTGLLVKMSQTMGLHRDPERFELDPEEATRRRQLFWELYTYDMGQALQFSLPPAIAGAYFDVKPLVPDNATQDQIFNAWKYRFTVECVAFVHAQAYGAISPPYATVIDMDRRVQAFPTPQFSDAPAPGAGDAPGQGQGQAQGGAQGTPPRERPRTRLQRHMVLTIRQEVLLYMHRGAFERATSEREWRKDPLKSPYAASVIAAYSSAHRIISLVRGLHADMAHPMDRIWFLWANLFTSSVILGSIVTRCPQLGFAREALGQLDNACELFSRLANGFRANKGLDKIIGFQQKAHASLSEFYAARNAPHAGLALHGHGYAHGHVPGQPPSPDSDEDLLTKFGGRTRLIDHERDRDRKPDIHMLAALEAAAAAQPGAMVASGSGSMTLSASGSGSATLSSSGSGIGLGPGGAPAYAPAHAPMHVLAPPAPAPGAAGLPRVPLPLQTDLQTADGVPPHVLEYIRTMASHGQGVALDSEVYEVLHGGGWIAPPAPSPPLPLFPVQMLGAAAGMGMGMGMGQQQQGQQQVQQQQQVLQPPQMQQQIPLQQQQQSAYYPGIMQDGSVAPPQAYSNPYQLYPQNAQWPPSVFHPLGPQLYPLQEGQENAEATMQWGAPH